MHGSKRDAQDMPAKRLAEHADGDLVTRSALTVAAYARHWLGTIAPAQLRKDAGTVRAAYQARHRSPDRFSRIAALKFPWAPPFALAAIEARNLR